MNTNSTKTLSVKSGLRFIPYAALGILVFALNSNLEFNYFVKGYLTILECQAGIVLVYFLMQRATRTQKRHKN